MFELAEQVDRDMLFSGDVRRPAGTVFFCRLIGYEDGPAYIRRMQEWYLRAEKKGFYWKAPLPNPAGADVERFTREVASAYLYEEGAILRDIRASLPGIEGRNAQLLAAALSEMMARLESQGSASSILKNAYVKFLCWLRGPLADMAYHVGEMPLPLLLCEGAPGKYEVYLWHILARAGCDILYIDPLSEGAYRKADPSGELSVPVLLERRGPSPVDFSKIDRAALEAGDTLRRRLEADGPQIDINRWLLGEWEDALFKTNEARGGLSRKINSLFIRYVGVDDPDLYRNRLFALRKKLEESGKPFVLVDNRLENPDMAHVNALGTVSGTARESLLISLLDKVVLGAGREADLRFQKAFAACMLEEDGANLTRLRNTGVQLVCWLRKYGAQLCAAHGAEGHLPLFLYYGGCTPKERDFLGVLARAGIDILVITPDTARDAVFDGTPAGALSRLERLPDTMPCGKFPDKEAKVRVSTTAYNAERELDSILYDGTGLFRNRQFARSHPVTLRTTYEEAIQLWGTEAKYRPYFKAEGSRVDVPNLFIKVCGVKDGASGPYFNTVRGLITEETVVTTKIPMLIGRVDNPIKFSVNEFCRDGRILPDKIKDHPKYGYDYLKEDTQDYMLEKMQELIDLKWIQSDQEHLEYTVLATLLNLDKQYLQLIQNFDFTGDVPKLLVLDNVEATFNLEDCILILFLNLIGFDVAVFTPTGYRNLEKYIARSAYEEYTIGEFVFDLSVPPLRPLRRAEGKGLMGKLFGKR